METLNSITSSASKAIWGDSSANQATTEPKSGELGKGTTSDPYDHGNEEQKSTTDTSTTSTSATSTSATPTTTTATHENKPPTTSGVDTTENRSGPSEAASGDIVGDPKSGQANTPKQQGADRPNEAPSSNKDNLKMPHSDEEREKLMEKGEFPHDPNDHSGEPLKMHDDGEHTTQKTERSDSVGQEGGNPHGKTMGTGEEYVKSSGMDADGGDFDASNPGAGTEATRLMEEKGLKTEGARLPPDSDSNKSTSTSKLDDNKVKVSKMDKIKEKLHLKH